MTEIKQETEKITPLWQKIALITGGTIFAVALALIVLILFPNLIGGNPLERSEAGTTVDVTFHMSDGDNFFHLQGRIRPPKEDLVLGQYTLSWDKDGFRIPQMQADHYPIAAFGDSFTEGTSVAEPWPDILASILDVPVRNYGYRGYGPNEIAATAQEFAGADDHTWLLYAHFSGNDLADANRSSLRDDLMARGAFTRLEWIADQAKGIASSQVVTNDSGKYDYPMPVIIGGGYYEMSFIDDLLFWQVAPEGGFLNTKTMDVVENALDKVANSVPPSTCRALIFIPSKEQLYYPYVHVDVRQWIRGVARATVIQSDGEIGMVDRPMSAEEEPEFLSRLGEQRDAMREIAEKHGYLFIDLYEPFKQAVYERGNAGEGLLYYQYDTHWTEAGHQLAAEIIAKFMQDHSGDCPLTFN